MEVVAGADSCGSQTAAEVFGTRATVIYAGFQGWRHSLKGDLREAGTEVKSRELESNPSIPTSVRKQVTLPMAASGH